MGKFDDLKVLRKTKGRVDHVCSKCGAKIVKGADYYKEHIEDKFLHSLHAKHFCSRCFEECGEGLLRKS